MEEEFHDCVDGPSEPSEAELHTTLVQKVTEDDVEEIERDDKDTEEVATKPLVVKDLDKSLQWKEKGNDAFKARDFDLAVQCYSLAIAHCPNDDAENLSTFFGNRSASYFAEEEYELVIADCNSALEKKPDYLKVLARRMQAYEKIEKYEEALTDAQKVKEIDPSYPKIVTIIARLQKAHDEKLARMKDEALGKLKELGNSILGNFGMSLDNFKMTQDPTTGGWSVSMNR